MAAAFPEYDDDKYGTVTLQQFAHSIGITLYEGMWMSRAYSMKFPAEIKENMYFAIETFAGHPGLQQTCRLEENVLVSGKWPRGVHVDGAHGRGHEALTMAQRLVAVSDSVFPNLDLARGVVSRVGAELRMAAQPTPEAIVEVARDADALLVTYAKITAEMIREMKRCRIISRFGIGVDNVDIAAATAEGIVVTKVPDYCIDEVSDHAMALLLSLVRKIPFSSARAHAGRWEMPAVVPIHRLRGTVLGLVGFGRIPQTGCAQGEGVRLARRDVRSVRAADGVGSGRRRARGVRGTGEDVGLHFDPHAAASGDASFVQRGSIRQMKPGAVLVNTSRGPVVDEAALAHALDAGQLAGAALDVLEQEPPVSSPLFGRDNVILTPHTSFYSVEALEELQTKAAEEVVRVLSGEPPAIRSIRKR